MALKQVFRRLRQSPMFAFTAVITLALGIGANTAIFSVVEGILLKPLPYPDPDRLIALNLSAPSVHMDKLSLNAALYFVLTEQNRTFESLGIYTGNRVSVTGFAEPERVPSMLFTYGVLPTLGARPLLGRLFTVKDDSPNTPPTVILTYGYWQRRFSGDPGAVGRRILIDGTPKEIVGILPKSFRFLDSDAELFEPFQFDRGKQTLGNFSYDGVARLKRGVSIGQAEAQLNRMIPIMLRSFPAPPGFSVQLFEQVHIIPKFHLFKDEMTGDIGKTLWILMGTIGVVLLIACANVANLLLVRVESRHLELTIRSALGASLPRIASELLLESTTIAVIGGAAGLALAYGALRLLVAVAPAGLPRVAEIGIDPPVLLFALAISIFTGLLFGSAPVLKYAVSGLSIALRDGGRSLTTSRQRQRASNSLVVIQVALALVLLISSGLMIRTFLALNQVQPGFGGAAQLETFSLSIPDGQVKEPEKVVRMHRDIQDSIARAGGVSSVAMTTCLPMTGDTSTDVLFARDHTYGAAEIPPVSRFIFITPELPRTLGMRLIAGHIFDWSDIESRRPVVVVSENLARKYWGSAAAAMHKQVREGMNDGWREVIGVVGDVRMDGVDKEAPTVIYLPIAMDNFWGEKKLIQRVLAFVVQTNRAGSEDFMKQVRKAVWSINPNLPLARVRTMDQVYRNSMARTSFTLVLLVISAGMALVLGAIGIYGVIAYSVSQRTREIGIRMALGARQSDVQRMFLRRGFLLTATGSAIGLLAASLLMRLLSSLLFGVSSVDPLTYSATLAALMAIATLASYLPSRRATTVDPATTLRSE